MAEEEAQRRVIARRRRTAERDSSMAVGTATLADQLRRDAPGQWTDNRLEQSNHYRGIIYIAIRALMDAVLSSTVQLNKKHRRYHNTSLAILEKALPTPHANSEDEQFRPFDDPDHSLVKLLDRPNRSETFNELLAQLVMQYQLTGSGLLWANPNKLGLPAELYVLPTALCYAQPATPDYPEGWWRVTQYYPSGGYGILPSPIAGGGAPVDGRDIFAFKNPHPLWRWDAMSPLTAGSVQLDILESIDQARWTAMDQGLTPDMVLLAPGVQQVQLDAWLERLKHTNIGKRNHRKVLAVGGDQGDSKFDVKFPSTTAKDMDFSGGWDQMTAYALALFGVPKSVAGLATTGSYAELYAALKQFHTLTLRPLVQRLGVWLTRHLARIWADDLAVQLDLPTIDDQQLQEQQLGVDLAHDGVTYNEYRAIRGRKPVPGGDVLVSVYVQQQQAKAQAAMQAQQAPPQPEPGAAPPDAGVAPGDAPPDAGQQPPPPNGPPAGPGAAPAQPGGAPAGGQPPEQGDALSQLLGTAGPDQSPEQLQGQVARAALAGLGVPQEGAEPVQKGYEPQHLKGVANVGASAAAGARAPGARTGVAKNPGAKVKQQIGTPAGESDLNRSTSDGKTQAGNRDQTPGSTFNGPTGRTFLQSDGDQPVPVPRDGDTSPPVANPAPKPPANPPANPPAAGAPLPVPDAENGTPSGRPVARPAKPLPVPGAPRGTARPINPDNEIVPVQPPRIVNGKPAPTIPDAIARGGHHSLTPEEVSQATQAIIGRDGFARVTWPVGSLARRALKLLAGQAQAVTPGDTFDIRTPEHLMAFLDAGGKLPPRLRQRLEPLRDRTKPGLRPEQLRGTGGKTFVDKIDRARDNPQVLSGITPEQWDAAAEAMKKNGRGFRQTLKGQGYAIRTGADLKKFIESGGQLHQRRRDLLEKLHQQILDDRAGKTGSAPNVNDPAEALIRHINGSKEHSRAANQIGLTEQIIRGMPPDAVRALAEQAFGLKLGGQPAQQPAGAGPHPLDEHARAMLGDRPHVEYDLPDGRHAITDGRSLQEFYDRGGRLSQEDHDKVAEHDERQKLAGVQPAPPDAVKQAAETGQPVPDASFDSAARAVRAHSPAHLEHLARVREWAAQEAIHHAHLLANHLGIDDDKAHDLLTHAIASVARRAALRAGAAGGQPDRRLSARTLAARQHANDIVEHIHGGTKISPTQAGEFVAAMEHLPPEDIGRLASSLVSQMPEAQQLEIRDLIRRATATVAGGTR